MFINTSRLYSRRFFALIGIFAAIFALIGGGTRSSAAPGYDWLQFNGSASHTGNNTQESAITLGNVSTLTQKFKITLPDVADGAPVYLTNVTTSGGTRDLVFVTTHDGHIVALDATTGATVWSQQYGPGTCTINNGGTTCYTTSSPAIDPNRQYVYSYGLDGKAHKYLVGDGTEITTGGWPELTTLKNYDEKGSSALTIATDKAGDTFLYVTNGGYPGDNGDYQGHITTINLATGAQAVFNALCSNQAVHLVELGPPDCPQVQSAVWARAGVVYDPATDHIYAATGNGDFKAALHEWGDSVFALNPNGTGSGNDPIDTWTPHDQANLQGHDQDIGSTAPAILTVPSGYPYPHLAVQGGKDANLRILNLDNLSNHTGGPQIGNTSGEWDVISVPQGGEVLTAPAVWVNPADNSTWVFVANDNGLSAFQLDTSGATPALTFKWQNSDSGTSPIIANGVLYVAGNNILRVLDPITGAQVWSTPIGGIHWESPIVANGVVYVTDNNKALFAFAPTLPATPPATAPATLPATFPATAAATVPATLPVTAPATTTSGSTPSSGSANSNSPSVQIADPLLVKTIDEQLAVPGQPATFTLTVTNVGAQAATSVSVTDPVPAAFIVGSATTSQGTFNISGNTVTFTIGTVNPGQTITLTIAAKVSGSLTPPLDEVNQATLNYAQGLGRSASVAVHITSGTLPLTGEHPDPASNAPLATLIVTGIGASLIGLMVRRNAGKKG